MCIGDSIIDLHVDTWDALCSCIYLHVTQAVRTFCVLAACCLVTEMKTYRYMAGIKKFVKACTISVVNHSQEHGDKPSGRHVHRNLISMFSHSLVGPAM